MRWQQSRFRVNPFLSLVHARILPLESGKDIDICPSSRARSCPRPCALHLRANTTDVPHHSVLQIVAPPTHLRSHAFISQRYRAHWRRFEALLPGHILASAGVARVCTLKLEVLVGLRKTLVQRCRALLRGGGVVFGGEHVDFRGETPVLQRRQKVEARECYQPFHTIPKRQLYSRCKWSLSDF